MADRIPADVFPPGDLIREELEARGWTQAEFAEVIGRSAPAISDVITGKAKITSEMSEALGEAFGVSPGYFLRLQATFDAGCLTEKKGETTRRAALHTAAPVTEMVKRGWIEPSRKVEELERFVCQFFGIARLEDPPSIPGFAMRKGSGVSFNRSHAAWLMRVKQLGHSAPGAAFSTKRFENGLSELKQLVGSAEDSRKVPRVLADMGIRFVIVEHLSKTRIDGVCLWLDRKTPIVALSLRYERLDQFWYTLMHELGHVREGDGLDSESNLDVDLIQAVSEDRDDRPEPEKKADAFAAESLIPKAELENFIARVHPFYSTARIQGFANRLGVHESIVIGQLQHLGKIPFTHGSKRIASCGVRSILTEASLTDGWGRVISRQPSQRKD
ncbi:MAG: helix-turn-helix domain-containing protein [Planctomycetes bacterium]|nr:helix-turn-helix domain-containing protein [Planctomycetota bacterium]